MPVPKGIRVGGRQKGTKNKTTVQRERGHDQIVAKASAEGVTPLEVMLGAMREAWSANDKAGAAEFAKDAAPYIHPRLAAVEHSGSMAITHEQALEELEAAEAALNGHEQSH
jgi:hypothetical protein